MHHEYVRCVLYLCDFEQLASLGFLARWNQEKMEKHPKLVATKIRIRSELVIETQLLLLFFVTANIDR